MLTIDGLNQFYGDSHILWDVELAVARQHCVCIIGRNGVGKTTLLRSLMGLERIRGGSIRFGDQRIERHAPEARVRLGIGYVPQGRMIFPLLTVRENLQISLPARRAPRRTIPEFVFELFPALTEHLGRRGGDLSGGQQQQLAIARALVLEPDLLVLDEPCEGIQPNVVEQIGHAIRTLVRERGMSVLLVEQKLPFARAHADAYALMDRGRVVETGAMDELTDASIHRYLMV